MRSAVTVSLVPEARGGPFVFWDDLPAACAAARALGFDAVEVFPPGPEAVPPAALFADHGLAVAAVGTGAGWVRHKLTLTSGDADVRARSVAFVRSIVEAAGRLGAPAIIGSMQGRWGEGVTKETAIEWLGEALAELGGVAAKFGVPLLYEPLNRYETNLVNTVADGVRLVAGLSHVRLLADLYHMNIEEANLAAAVRAGAGAIGHVHFADSNRRAAGMGHTDFAPVVAALREVGYAGYLSAEVLPLPDPTAAARATIEAFRAVTASRAA